MSRVGLGKRLAMAEAAIRTQNPFGYALHNLPANMRAKHDRWREACDTAAGSSGEAGARYAALLQGASFGPAMPADLQAALKLSASTHHEITIKMSVADAAACYERVLERESR